MPFLDPEGNGVRILSLDGGDERCMSQLLMLEELMHRLEYDHGRSVRPCEFFHSITGVGAAGVIAILLGVLGMTIDNASKTFAGICEKVFAVDVCDAASRSKRLALEMEGILDEVNVPLTARMEGDVVYGAGCHVSICYSAASINSCRMFRSYKSRHLSRNPTIVEAAQTSWATPGLFSSILLGPSSRQEELISAVNGFNNPTLEAIREAREVFGTDRPVSILLSLGSGANCPVSIYSSRFLQSSIQQTDITEDSIDRDLGPLGIYFRFSPDYTNRNETFAVGDSQFSSITSHTRVYLERAKTIRSMEIFLKLSARTSNFNLDLRNDARPAPASSAQLPATSRLSPTERAILAELRIKDLHCGSPVTGCMKGTREGIMKMIKEWTINFDSPNILWLKGYPGVGKSAIATEIVEQLDGLRRLGSSFFFQRQNATLLTPHALWRTVAYDLARKHPSVRRSIIAKLEEQEVDPANANLEKLFHHFIHQPLIGSSGIPNARLPVIVIDALDECGGLDEQHSGYRRGLMNTLQYWSCLPTQFRLIVTSRGEHDMEHLFSKITHYPIEIPAGRTVDSQSSEDIRMFLTEQLHQITIRYSRSLSPSWPGAQIVTQLAERAAGLFLWAETVVKFISRGEPEQLLSQVLEGGETGDIFALYEQILTTAFQFTSERDINNFRSVVGAIILAKAPLSFSSLSRLLSMKESTLEYICSGLQSVLEFQDTVQFRHQSFADFLLNPNKGTPIFLIQPVWEKRNLALACLRVMKDNLRFNICDLDSSHLRNVDIPSLASRADENIPPHLFYSCCWWASHLAEIEFDVETFVHVQHFMYKQFLCWLEVLSITKRVNLGSQMLSSLINWIPPRGQEYALEMANDMQKFVTAFASVISQSVPHIYISALPFSPQNSPVSEQYMSGYPKTLTIQIGGLSNWPAVQNVLTGHSDCVMSVAFSPNGELIASGSLDNTIRVWDSETGGMISGPFEGHSGSVMSLAFSSDGKQIASGADDSTICVWDAETGALVTGPFIGHTGVVYSVAFSPDAKHIGSGAGDTTVCIWDTKTGGAVAAPFEGHKDDVNSTAFSPDGKCVVSGSQDRSIRLWDVKTGTLVTRPFRGHSGGVYSVSFSPDGRHVVSGSYDKTIRVWNAETGSAVGTPFEGHSGGVYSVAFSADGKRIVSGSYDKTIRVWDADTGMVITGPFDGHGGGFMSVAFSPDGKRIVSGAEDSTVCVWDAEIGKIVATPFEGHGGVVYCVAFSPNENLIVSGADDSTIRVWDAQTGRAVTAPFEGHSGSIMSVAFSPDGKYIVSGADDGTICVWDLRTGVAVNGPFEAHDGVVYSVAFSPNGKYIASSADDTTVRIWHARSGRAFGAPFEGHKDDVNSTAFSPDGMHVASGSQDRTIRIWDVKTGGLVASPFKGHDGGVYSVVFSPDGRRLASGSYDKTVRVWDVNTGGMLVAPFEGHSGGVMAVAFSPNGKCIVSGSDDSTVRIWDAEVGRALATPFVGHRGAVYSVAFSLDGTSIVSGSEDKTLRAWHVLTHGSEVSQPLPPFNHSSRMEDGWVLGPNSELLIWVPPALRDGLWRPGNTLVIGQSITTRLDVDSFVHGSMWSLCKAR